VTDYGPCPRCGFESMLSPEQRHVVTLPMRWPSQNEIGSNARGRAGWRYRILKSNARAAMRERLSALDIPSNLGAYWVRCVFTRLYSTRCRAFDYGNLVGGFKPLLDVLRETGVVPDDSPDHIEDFYLQRPSGTKENKIRIDLQYIRRRERRDNSG